MSEEEQITLVSEEKTEKEKVKPITNFSEEKQQFTPIEAINEFYRLKDKYETMYHDKYIKPILKSKKSKREKRVDFSRLPKKECINCKRNVGTIFNISSDKTSYIRKFIAKCGDLNDPCPLDIQIDYGSRAQYDITIREGLKIIEDIKLNIIKEKNNALFFKYNVVDSFSKLTEKLKYETEHTGFVIETNILKNNNPEKQSVLDKTVDEFGKGCILPFKQMIKKYMDTNDELVLNEALNFYVYEMIPKLNEIQKLKYNVNYIEYDENYNPSNSIIGAYKLIQLPNSLENTEFFIESDDKVLRFVKGVKKNKKATTKKIGDFASVSKKTRKLKPVGDLVIEEEIEIPKEVPKEGTASVPYLVNKDSIETLEGIPNFDAPGGVEWDNKKYNELWSSVPKALKDILLTDKEWLQEYMVNCVAARKAGKRCNLFLPSHTRFPPEKTVDGTYDFGVNAINKLFNGFEPSYQKTLLTLYSEKDGVKNYNMLRDALGKILKKKIESSDTRYFRGYY